MKHSVLTITLNPAYDLVGSCPTIELGEVNLVKMIGLHPAGKGINVAKVLSNLGVKVNVSGFLGCENQDGFMHLFSDYGFENRFQLVEGRTRINVKLTEGSGEVTDLNFSGFSVLPGLWQEFKKNTLQLAKQVDLISVNGSLPEGITAKAFSEWLSELTESGTRVLLDSSRDALSAGLAARPWLIKPNDNELSMWAGKPLTQLDEIIDAARHVITQGIENVVVSLGSKGAIWVTSGEIWLAKPPVCPVVSTVGAGDSMVAGLMYGTLAQKTIPETLRLASAIAALSVGQANVGIPDTDELTDMIKKISVTAIK